MVLKSPNKYTQKLELFIVEITRNCDKLTCAYQDQQGPHSGLNIFRFEESKFLPCHNITISGLFQFHGPQIWYCPLKQALSRDQERLLVDFIWSNCDKDLTPPSNQVGQLGFHADGVHLE